MKISICIYHKEPFNKYNPEWICECLKSIKDQCYSEDNEYTFIELNYSNMESDYPISLLELGYFENIESNKKIKLRKIFDNHISAMNYCFDYSFSKINMDICFNIHIDDIYDKNRFEKSLEYIKDGYEIITSNVIYSNESRKKYIDLNINNLDDKLLLKLKIQEKKNIIVLSSLCITKNAWEQIEKISPTQYLNGYILMKKIIKNNIKMKIIKDYLVCKRINK